MEDAISLVPEAVVEVVQQRLRSEGPEIGPPFYLAQGVKDVIVFDPTSLMVLHARREKTARLTAPQVITLECGCELAVRG